jgi:hypothetical protein
LSHWLKNEQRPGNSGFPQILRLCSCSLTIYIYLYNLCLNVSFTKEECPTALYLTCFNTGGVCPPELYFACVHTQGKSVLQNYIFQVSPHKGRVSYKYSQQKHRWAQTLKNVTTISDIRHRAFIPNVRENFIGQRNYSNIGL